MDDSMSDAPAEHSLEQEQQSAENKNINEEYKAWKKSTPFLYDLLYTRALEWPTLSVQWLPDKKPIEGTNLSQHRCIIGTHTSGQAQNYLQLATCDIPNFRIPNLAELDEQRGEAGGFGHAKAPFEFKIAQRINHPGEVNKARYQPQNPNIIASLCVDGRVLIFDRSKHPLNPANDSIKFELELVGHEREGFGLNWSPLIEGHLVTGNEDQTVRTWDLQSGFTKENNTIRPTATYEHHSATVNDVEYHPVHKALIGSVSDDLTWQVIDTRMQDHKVAKWKKEAHADAVNCLAFHPEFDMLMATGSADKSIAIWDLRNIEKPLHVLESHKDAVMNLQWHPQDTAILASSSYDRRILVWDISKFGDEQTPDEAEDGPPELIFMHGGFINRISDFDWNKNDEWVMLAAAEDNQLQVFRAARKLVEPIKKNTTHSEVSD